MKLYEGTGSAGYDLINGDTTKTDKLNLYAEVENYKEASNKVWEYAKSKRYGHYLRVTAIEDADGNNLGCWFDYGSYTHFFYLIF